MKVIYHKPIHQRIAEARRDALMQNKPIEKIVVTESEMDELAAWCESAMYYAPGGLRWLHRPKPERVTQFMGIRIEQEQ